MGMLVTSRGMPGKTGIIMSGWMTGTVTPIHGWSLLMTGAGNPMPGAGNPMPGAGNPMPGAGNPATFKAWCH